MDTAVSLGIVDYWVVTCTHPGCRARLRDAAGDVALFTIRSEARAAAKAAGWSEAITSDPNGFTYHHPRCPDHHRPPAIPG